MIMKHLLTCLALVVLTNISWSQSKPKVKIGDKVKSSSGYALSEIIGADKNGFYTIQEKKSRLSKGVILVEQYDHNMDFKYKSKIKLEYKGKRMQYAFAVELKDKIYLFSTFKNSKLKQNFLFCSELDKVSLRLRKNLKLMGSIPIATDLIGRLFQRSSAGESFEYASNVNGQFNFQYSADSSLIGIYYAFPGVNGAKKQIGMHVVDENMETVWEATDRLPHVDKLIDIKDFEVDNEGNFHILAMVFNEKRKEKKSKTASNYKFQLYSFRENGTQQQVQDLKIGKKFITEMDIEINNNLELFCGGFYADEKGFHSGTNGISIQFGNSLTNEYKISGYFFQRSNAATGEILATKVHEFPMDFILENRSKRDARKTSRKAAKGKDVGLEQYEMRDMELTPDGGAILLGEQFRAGVVQTVSSDGSTSSDISYFFGDIMAIRTDSEGNEIWKHKIGKYQSSRNYSKASSFSHAFVDDRLHLVFNDTEKNVGYKDDNDIRQFKLGGRRACTMAVCIEPEGTKIGRKPIMYYSEHKTFVVPSKGKRFNDSLILIAERQRKQRLMRMEM